MHVREKGARGANMSHTRERGRNGGSTGSRDHAQRRRGESEVRGSEECDRTQQGKGRV